MSKGGWIKLHRQLLANPVFKNDKLFRVFIYLLLSAQHTEGDLLIGDAVVHLEVGQWATGRHAIARDTGLTEQNVRTALSKLEKLGMLTIKPTTKYSIFSITNWSKYQQDNQQVTNSQPTANQQVTTNNNVKKEKNEQEGKEISNLPAKAGASSSSEVKEIFDYWIQVMGKDGKSKLTKEREGAVKARLKDGYTVDQIKLAIYGCSVTPHNMGQNDNGKPYNDLELICRKGSNVERFAENANHQQTGQKFNSVTTGNINSIQGWINGGDL